jgi:MFS family permease
VAGRLVDRTGRYRLYPLLGGMVSLVGVVLFARLDVHSAVTSVMVAAAALGLGIGLAMQTLLLALQNAVDTRDTGVATSTTFLLRQLGSVVGIAVLGSVFTTRLRHWLPELTPASAHLDVRTLRGSPSSLRHLSPRVHAGVVDAFARSLHSVFLWLIPIAVVAIVLAVILPELPLRGTAERSAAEDLALNFEAGFGEG